MPPTPTATIAVAAPLPASLSTITGTAVVTLIGHPLPATLPALVCDRLRTLQASVAPPQWLEPEIACDIVFEGGSLAIAEAGVWPLIQGLAVDMFVQDSHDRRKALLLADMDSTIVVGETLDEVAALARKKRLVAAITARGMRGELDFAASFRARMALLAGQPERLLHKVAAGLVLTAGAKTLVATMKAHGAYTVLVSGGFPPFTERVAGLCGFDEVRANRIETSQGKLTGQVIEPILGAESKQTTLLEVCGKRHLRLSLSCAVGDGANDIPLLQAAGLGVAFHAKPKVRAAIHQQINHGDLHSLLYAQGYRRDEFVLD